MKQFSVIVPLYNKAPYVQKSLESIVHQTYRDFELIVVNDGSTDDSANIAEKYLNEHHGDVLFKILHQPNSGVSVARNNGVAASTGKYIAFLDADDWWELNFLEEMSKLIDQYPDAGLYASNYVYYKPGKTHVALNGIQSGYINYPKEYFQNAAMIVTSITVCIPRSVWEETGGFPIGVKYGEDFLLWCKIALHYKVAYTSQPLAYYNNDIPASMRATRNLYAPEYNMVFHFNQLETEIAQQANPHSQIEWKQLLDRERVEFLLSYLMDDRYHDIAQAEMAKIDWKRQSLSTRLAYKQPKWFYKVKNSILKIGSYFKQRIIHLLNIK